MAKAHHRVFALIFAILFLGTSVATGLAVIWQINQDNQSQQAGSQTEKQNPFEDLMQDCSKDEVAAPKENIPEVYKPQGGVKELEKTDITEGSGDGAKLGDCLAVKYHGTLARDGKKFDGNFDKEGTFQFALGFGQVISGWDEGLMGMKEGGVRRLVIPADKAYGESGQGASIPPNADLVFVVKLIKITKK